MTVFVDTSAVMAVADADERNHPRARPFWVHLVADQVPLVTTNYVVVEAMCLLQRRLALEALARFLSDVVPLLRVEWITPERHCAAVEGLTAWGRRELGIVDCASFGVMRGLGLTHAFAFDRHFADQGFEVVP